MATSFVSQSTVNYANRTNTTIPAPIGIQDGDRIGLVFSIFGNAPAAPIPTFPAGFNSVGAPYPIALQGDDLLTYGVIKNASGEAGDYVVTHDNGNTTAYMVVVRGASGIVFGTGNTSATDTVVIDGITSIEDGSFILLWGVSNDVLGAVTPPGSPPVFDERFDSALSILYAATGIMSPPGATGDKTLVLSLAPTAGGIILFEAEPPPGGGGGWIFDDWI